MPDTPYQTKQLAGACADCGRRYGDTFGFPDLCIDDEAWQKISPRGGHGGLLCPSCIIRRLVDAGIKCHGRFMSGPLYDAEEGKEAEINDLHAELGKERERREKAEAERDRLREALEAIIAPDELVLANKGAFSVHALKRVKEIARYALGKPAGGAS